ncbi:uncharacterized protein TRIADDRAFT_53572 [Trichoplax adhaerens]|uniref:SKICH domain-containing protein n=1 Tax=Trichoplax adhaerens TaxID=10228 RepID=B3RPK4_TRIAD|nr:hypothetical protein TRIADDRAFT_53572 [Trichoplax adhaerens]EDV28206.1 hypothetical protein TRIADDRAFT_53572 [Trichoplax adhaerens]|eukprot:XP_002110040.1 hypothetical protein TRIADDRAFT_53572 [Trichoplax adhaerens]
MEAKSSLKVDISFTNIQGRYHRGDNIQFDVEGVQESNCNDGDWIGLFKVGWKSEEDCLLRQYVGTDCSNDTHINKYVLPIPQEITTESTYQLCYMNHKNRLVAVSRSFTILPLELDEADNDYDWLDLFNVQGDVVVVSRQNNNETIPTSFEDLIAANMTLESQLSSMKIEKDALDTLLAESKQSVNMLKSQVEQVRADNQAKAQRIDELELEQEKMAINLSSYEDRLTSALDKLSESEQMKGQYSLTVDNASLENQQLKAMITNLQEIIENNTTEIATIKDMLNQSNDDLQNAHVRNDELKDVISHLESLMESSQANDTLVKDSLIGSINILRRKDDHEEAENFDSRTLLDCAQVIELEVKKCTDALTIEKNHNSDFEEIIRILQEESKSYQDEIERLSRELRHKEREEKTCAKNSTMALYVAHEHLEEQHVDAVKKGKALYRRLSDSQTNLKFAVELNTNLKRQVADLYARLDMSKEAYKDKVIECYRLQNEIKIAKDKANMGNQYYPLQDDETMAKRELQAKKEELMKELSTKNAQIQILCETRASSEQEMNLMIQELAACHDSLEQKQSEIDSLKAKMLHSAVH